MIMIDIPMPEKCSKCPFVMEYRGTAGFIHTLMCVANENRIIATKDKPEWCPLKEVKDEEDNNE